MISTYILVIQVFSVCGISTDKLHEYKYSSKEYDTAVIKYKEMLLTVGKVTDNCIITEVKAGHRKKNGLDK